MIYSGKITPTEWMANIKAIIEIDTSEEISIEELRRMIKELREVVMTDKPILLSDSEMEGENE